jgi:hypothetical protein
MRSFLAALRSLVLPYGATSGPRIILDGIKGLIQVINSGGIIQLDPNATIPIISFISPSSPTKMSFINAPMDPNGVPQLGINSGLYNSAYFAEPIKARLYMTSSGSSSLQYVDVNELGIGGQANIGENFSELNLYDKTGTLLGEVTISPNRVVMTGNATSPYVLVNPNEVQIGTGNTPNYVHYTNATGYLEDGVNGAWVTLTPMNGWSHRGAPLFENFGYKVTPDGRVQFRGSLNVGTNTNGTQIANTLPVGIRPAFNKVCQAGGDGSNNVRLYVTNDGIPHIYGVPTSGGNVGFDSASYSLI